MRSYIAFCLLTALCASLLAAPVSHAATPQKRDYLSEEEADKIRDADTPNARVKLFLSFAADRLKKFQYELERTQPESRRGETLNGLLNAYSACVDDAADVMSLAIEKQQEIRAGIKEIQSKGKEFLTTLHKFEQKNPDLDAYKQTLDDAIEGTEDAIHDAEKAEKELSPTPTRRPQS
jgi:chromosome segregation ATPase